MKRFANGLARVVVLVALVFSMNFSNAKAEVKAEKNNPEFSSEFISWFNHLFSSTGEGFAYVTDMTPVDIDLIVESRKFWNENRVGEQFPEPQKLRIPKAFMNFSGNWKGGDQKFVRMVVLPDMSPAALAKDPYDKKLEKISISLNYFVDKHLLYKTYIVDVRKNYIPVESDSPLFDQYLSGQLNPDASGYDLKQSTVYIPKNVELDNATYVECKNVEPMCEMYDNLDKKVRISFLVDRKGDKQDWIKIRTAVRKLVLQFLAN